MIVDRRAEVVNLQNNLQGHCYDMEYAIGYALYKLAIILFL